MKNRRLTGVGVIVMFTFCAGIIHGQSDLCLEVHMKPVLSLQQTNQAELVHYLVVLAGLQPPSPEGKNVEEFYQEEVQMLTEAGYPPVFQEVEPDRLVTRRYFASVMYQVAVASDEEFASRHGGLTDETKQFNALVESEWLYAEEGRIYRDEILSILCTNDIVLPPTAPAVEIFPEEILEANLETPRSPI